jgi:DNA (cytosine-5)-methyltransferase 1
MPSGTLFDPSSDPAALFGEAQQLFGRTALAAKLDVDRKTISRWQKAPQKLPLARQLALREILRTAPRQESKDDFTFIDLFAGIGGMRRLFCAHRFLSNIIKRLPHS